MGVGGDQRTEKTFGRRRTETAVTGEASAMKPPLTQKGSNSRNYVIGLAKPARLPATPMATAGDGGAHARVAHQRPFLNLLI
jgi:hypothetical protein